MQAQMRVQALQPPMMQQANTQAQQAHLAANAGDGQQLGQIGIQDFGQQLEDYVRNCTPGRHELFARD